MSATPSTSTASTPDHHDPHATRERLRVLYSEVDAAVAAHGPVCGLSGRCCRFLEFDHTLFLSAVELDFLLAEAPPPARPLDDGATCPWQDGSGLCTARAARPLGCRVYFCDPAYLPLAPTISELFIGRLKQVVEAEGLPWDYAPLHRHLHEARSQGRWVPSTGSPPDPRAEDD